MNKVYRNKRTKEMFMEKVEGINNILISLHNGREVVVLYDFESIYEVVDVSPVELKPTTIVARTYSNLKTSFRCVQDVLNSEVDLHSCFSVGDTYYIPTEGFKSSLPFEIVHIDYVNRKLYFGSHNILARMPMSEVESWLKDFKSKLPWDLVEHLKPIEHINSTGTHRNLISLPSIRNMGKDVDYCTGTDDVMFDKFKDEASRCKNFKGETQWYWTDTPHISTSTGFWIVLSSGFYGYFGANGSGGVCPCFMLSKDSPVKDNKEN